jgi:hypothetical protein
MVQFREWLLVQESALVDAAVAASYERGLQSGLNGLISRTRDPGLRTTLERMRQCPVRDQSGSCRSFVDYITGTLIRNRCGLGDPEESLAAIYRQLMSPVNLQGQPRATLFGSFDEALPFSPGSNPVEARFKTSVGNAVRNLCQSDRRQSERGNVSIVAADRKEKIPTDAIAADEIPARGHGDDERELVGDIVQLLRIRQRDYTGLPLVDLFGSILAGETLPAQRAKFGWRAVDLGRKIIVQAVEDYARSTDNWALLRLLDKIRDPGTGKAVRQAEPAKAKLAPDQQDYRSIVDVLQRNGGTVPLGLLQKTRRRWTEMPPRDPTSMYPNKLEDVLARMTMQGILQEKRTRKGGRVYVPGAGYERYVAAAAG